MLGPRLTDSYKKETKAVRQQARKDLEDENKALPAKIRQIRGGQRYFGQPKPTLTTKLNSVVSQLTALR